MSLTSSDMTMPVQPMGNGYGNGFGGGDGLFWIIILFLFAAMGGWGNGGYGNGGQMPYAVNNDIQRGFDQASLTGGINGVSTALCNGFAGVQQSLCNGFAGVNGTVSNGFAQAEIANNARQMADMQQQFALQSQLAQCCCDNRAATNDLKYVIAQENCADRTAISDALRDVIASNNANTQAILDKMCQQELDALKTQNANLQTQLNLANLAASQGAQTATIQAGQRQLANEIEQYVLPTPRPAYIVQNPNCCTQNFGCGCGTV